MEIDCEVKCRVILQGCQRTLVEIERKQDREKRKKSFRRLGDDERQDEFQVYIHPNDSPCISSLSCVGFSSFVTREVS